MSVLNEHELEADGNGTIFTSFGSGGGANKSYYETTIGDYGSANVFYGVSASQVQVGAAPVPPSGSPRRPPSPKPPPGIRH
jgi:hypothetical protein